MTILVTEQYENEGRVSFEMATEKREAFVSYHAGLATITVLCHNAASRTQRFSPGKTFWSWEDAIAGYKSADMKAMIQHAREIATA